MNLNEYITIARKSGQVRPLQESIAPKDESAQASVGLSICERLAHRKPEESKPVQMAPAWSVPSN